jgi:hypothetical protein
MEITRTPEDFADKRLENTHAQVMETGTLVIPFMSPWKSRVLR